MMTPLEVLLFSSDAYCFYSRQHYCHQTCGSSDWQTLLQSEWSYVHICITSENLQLNHMSQLYWMFCFSVYINLPLARADFSRCHRAGVVRISMTPACAVECWFLSRTHYCRCLILSSLCFDSFKSFSGRWLARVQLCAIFKQPEDNYMYPGGFLPSAPWKQIYFHLILSMSQISSHNGVFVWLKMYVEHSGLSTWFLWRRSRRQTMTWAHRFIIVHFRPLELFNKPKALLGPEDLSGFQDFAERPLTKSLWVVEPSPPPLHHHLNRK